MVAADETLLSGPLEGLHVLVVDDNRDARAIYKAVLAHGGAYVTVLPSAAAAVRALKQVRPDIVVTDLAMPGRDGFWLSRWLRRRAASNGARIPVVAVTAREDVYDRGAMADVGLDDWLVKPVSHRELIRSITGLAGRLTPRRSA